jgi:hypothetical protein
MPPHRPTLAIAAALTLALAGCGKSATDGKVDVTTSDDKSQVTIKTDQGEAKISNGSDLAMPKDFPSDVHLPSSRYTVSDVVQIGPSTIVKLQTQAPLKDVSAEYDTAMKAAGWTEAMAMQSSQSEAIFSFQKKDRSVTVSLSAASDQGGTEVTVQHTAQKPGG